MSKTIQLEQLLNEKASMEDEGRELDEEQKQLKDRARALTEQIIEELRRKNAAKQESVNNLQSKVNALELELNSLSGISTSKSVEKTVETTSEAEEITTPLENQPQETPDDNVSVTEVAQEEDITADSKEKKRRFF